MSLPFALHAFVPHYHHHHYYCLFVFAKPLRPKPPTVLPTLQAFSSRPPTTDGHDQFDDIDERGNDNDYLRPLLVKCIEVDVPKMEYRGKHLDR